MVPKKSIEEEKRFLKKIQDYLSGDVVEVMKISEVVKIIKDNKSLRLFLFLHSFKTGSFSFIELRKRVLYDHHILENVKELNRCITYLNKRKMIAVYRDENEKRMLLVRVRIDTHGSLMLDSSRVF